jgi:hypothetical protein
MAQVVPNAKGRDLESKDRKYDAHIRTEALAPGESRVIFVDVFLSAITDANKAHVESQFFALSKTGAAEAADFLKGYGFEVTVAVRAK